MKTFNTYASLGRAIDKGFRFLPSHGPAQFKCSVCRTCKPLNMEGGGGTGYAVTADDKFICYDCAGARDLADMSRTGRATLYLTMDEPAYKGGPRRAKVTNWPGTLEIKTGYVHTGRHNMAGKRYDVWFRGPDGFNWHGVTYGDNTQVCHCKRIKGDLQ